QLAAEEKDRQLATLDTLTNHAFGALSVEARAALVFGGVNACVPDNDLAAAIFALGDHTLKRGVIEGMILGHHCQSLFAMCVRWPVRDRPRLEDAIGFQAKVVVEPARGMLLNDERQ